MKLNSSGDYRGLFGKVDGASARIENLTVNGQITCTSAATQYYMGGIAGYITGGATLYNCVSNVNITIDSTVNQSYIGGVAGGAGTATIDRCVYTGAINLGSGPIDCAAGIVAYCNGALLIQTCANNGSISSSHTAAALQVGGILGYVRNSTFAGIKDCVNSGALNISNDVISGGTTKLNAYTGSIIGRFRDPSPVTNITGNYYSKSANERAWGVNEYETLDANGNVTATTMPANAATSAAATAVSSGELCYETLNGGRTEHTSENPVIWRQSLSAPVDVGPVPLSSHPIVYYGYATCTAQDKSYTNNSNSQYPGSHPYSTDG